MILIKAHLFICHSIPPFMMPIVLQRLNFCRSILNVYQPLMQVGAIESSPASKRKRTPKQKENGTSSELKVNILPLYRLVIVNITIALCFVE